MKSTTPHQCHPVIARRAQTKEIEVVISHEVYTSQEWGTAATANGKSMKQQRLEQGDNTSSKVKVIDCRSVMQTVTALT